ncbi:MAG: DNA-binding winged helix-turn-helix (wHTH) protein/tetratricopeptide (TPR) repeat protein [Myxococcota bacterium]
MVLLGAPEATPGAQAQAAPVLTLSASAPLAAAVAALQAQVKSATVLSLSDCQVDLHRRQVLREDGAVSLSQREADLLAYLAARPGRMVTREELLLQVWEHVRVVPTRSVDMAVHRLRRKIEADPRKPSHLLSCRGGGYQLVLQEASEKASNVRPALTSFVGREQDCTDLAGRLEAGCRLLTVTGVPGVGKTRLALELARRQAGQGGWVCDLYPARDLEGIYMAIAVALGLDTSAPWQTTAALLEQELARRGEILLILDNAEHVIHPLAQVVPGLLAAAPGLKLLVTSQAPLEVTGEWLHPLPPLPQEHLKGSLLGTLAIGLAKQGQLEEALETFERSMRCLRAVGHDQRLAAIRHYRGVTLFRLGRLAEARRDYEEELAAMTALGDRRSQAHALEGLAQLAIAEGAPDRAIKAASAGLEQGEGCGDVVLLADLLLVRGLAHFLCDDLDDAAQDYRDASQLAGETLPPDHVVFLGCLQAALAMVGGPPHPPPSPRGDEFGFRPLLDALHLPSPERLRALCDPAASPDILVRLAAVAASHACDH